MIKPLARTVSIVAGTLLLVCQAAPSRGTTCPLFQASRTLDGWWEVGRPIRMVVLFRTNTGRQPLEGS